ncbi:MAG: glycerol-3-phosphate 1-O-acyltransferase PlsY [Armatimonadota bacterium]
MTNIFIVLILLTCYMYGSIPYGLIIGKITKGIDIRDFGSGNIGATNVYRTLGFIPASLVMILDTSKGYLAVFVCMMLGFDPIYVIIGALLALLGHTFSIFLKFSGGKGVATALGIIIGLNWLVAVIALGIWIILTAVTRYVSLASIIATISVPLMMFFWKSQQIPKEYLVFTSVIAICIIIKHKSNIKRLLNGTENKFGKRIDIENK